MTTAPACLTAARRLLLDHLDIHDGGTYPSDLDPAEVGIVGDPAHRGGYHCGSDRVVDGDYSVVESTRDRNGLSMYASALDVGSFTYGQHTLRTFSVWLVAQCKAGTADTRDIREVIYSPDGQTVRRWDRLGKRTTGDDSHLWHTHISYHRDAVRASRDQTAVIRRYLTEIGLLEDDMTPEELINADVVPAARPPVANSDYETNKTWRVGYTLQVAVEAARAANGHAIEALDEVKALRDEVKALSAPQIDYDLLADALLRRVLAAPQG